MDETSTFLLNTDGESLHDCSHRVPAGYMRLRRDIYICPRVYSRVIALGAFELFTLRDARHICFLAIVVRDS